VGAELQKVQFLQGHSVPAIKLNLCKPLLICAQLRWIAFKNSATFYISFKFDDIGMTLR
jgi:hypothetical protein